MELRNLDSIPCNITGFQLYDEGLLEDRNDGDVEKWNARRLVFPSGSIMPADSLQVLEKGREFGFGIGAGNGAGDLIYLESDVGANTTARSLGDKNRTFTNQRCNSGIYVRAPVSKGTSNGC